MLRNMFTEVLSVVVAAAALFVAIAATRTSAQVGRTQRAIAAASVMSELRREFNAAETRRQRGLVAEARKIRQAVSKYDLAEITNYFETVAWLVRNDVLPLGLVWAWLGDWIVYYWLLFEGEIGRMMQDTPGLWEDMAWLVPKLHGVSAKRGLPDPVEYFRRSGDRFLAREAALLRSGADRSHRA